jgi:glycosyl hydrolase family 123
MLRNRWCPLVASGLLLAQFTFGSDPSAVQTWFVDSLVKVFPGDPPGSHRLANPELLAARNQHVSVQLALRSTRPIKGVTAEVPPLEGSPGRAITGASIHPAGYVVVGSHTKNTPPEELVGEAPGWFPDPLLDFPIDLAGHRTRSLWITVPVPADAVPGIYHGQVVVRAEDRNLARVPFRLKVFSASVPPERTLKVTNWFELDDKAARQFYGLPQFSSGWWTLIDNVARVMADHRQNVVLTPLLSLIQPRAEGQQLVYDYSNFDRWVEAFRKAGTIGYIEGSHILGRAGSYDAPLQVETFQLEGDKVRRLSLPPDDPRVEPFLAGFLSALNAHLEEKGWKPIYFQHILDEAHGNEIPAYGRFAELVHRSLPGVPTLDAVDAAQMPEVLQRNCDLWVPQLGRFDQQMDLLRQRIQQGREVWFYTCLFPNQRYLNRLIDYPLLKVRLLHWFNFRYNFSGYLHWGWNYWSPEPTNDTQPVIDNNTELLPPGDAFIVYPDRARQSVFSSIRLEAMREGIEDYELLTKLRVTNAGEADRIAGAAIATFTDYVRNPSEFRKVESELLQALSK